jgi:hypothetical protein
MGAFTGGLTFRQYYVADPLPKDAAEWRAAFAKGIAEYAFKDINPASEEERAVGWCSPHFPLDIEPDESMYLYNEYVVLGLRIDTLGVPGPLLRIHTEQESRRMMEEQGLTNLSRYQKAEVKERVKIALKKKMLPSIKVVDMVWNWTDGRVRFYGGNEKVNMEFMEIFEGSFNNRLIPEAAFTACEHGGLNLTEAEVEALERVEPCAFVDTDTVIAAMKEV